MATKCTVLPALLGGLALLTACLDPNRVARPTRLFSTMDDAVVRPCGRVSADSLAPCRLPGSSPLEERAQIAATSTFEARGDPLPFAENAPAVSYVNVLGGIQLPLERITGTDLWNATILVHDIDHVRISYRFITDTMRVVPLRREFRGALARSRPLRSAQLHGTLRVDTVWSEALQEMREGFSYVPSAASAGRLLDVVYAADGSSVRDFAALVDTLIANGRLRPVALVGVRAAQPLPGDTTTRYIRAREYVYGFGSDSTRFLTHEQFFVDEVSAWAERTLHVSPARAARMIWGASNGGAFAMAMAMRHPDRYSRVFISSPVYNVIPQYHEDGRRLPEFFVTAGSFEETTRSRTVAFVQLLERLHAVARFQVLGGGHDDLLWSEAFVSALQDSESAD